jgi:hypothetical protein
MTQRALVLSDHCQAKTPMSSHLNPRVCYSLGRNPGWRRRHRTQRNSQRARHRQRNPSPLESTVSIRTGVIRPGLATSHVGGGHRDDDRACLRSRSRSRADKFTLAGMREHCVSAAGYRGVVPDYPPVPSR